MLSSLEQALGKILAPSLPPQIVSGQSGKPDAPNNTPTESVNASNDPRSERAYEAMRQRYPDRVEDYQEKLLASVPSRFRR